MKNMGVNLKNTTRVQVMVEVCAMGSWSMQTTLDQIHRQAKQEALGRLNKAFQDHDVRVIGDMRVIHIISEPDPLK